MIALQSAANPTPAELADMAADLFINEQFSESSAIWNELWSRMPHRSRIAYNLAASMFMMDSLAAADSTLMLVSDGVNADTLASAIALTDLALAIQMDDYGGVENAVSTLIDNISYGLSPDCERIALEAGLNWLNNHEPPEDQNQDQQDQNQDQQDQNEDQQDQNEEQQDQNEEQPQPPPQVDEMTPEQAQAILDLIEESLLQDSIDVGKAGRPSGPVW